MIKLQAGDRVRLATWAFPYDRTTVEVWTSRAYAVRYNEDPEAGHKRTLERGHPTAFTVLAPGIITNSRAFNEAKLAERDADMARAVILAPGDLVEIEGEAFTVSVPRGNLTRAINSDAIHFDRKREGV